MKYQWLLFDVDGTLFDYDLAETKALQGTFNDLALGFGTRPVRNTTGSTARSGLTLKTA